MLKIQEQHERLASLPSEMGRVNSYFGLNKRWVLTLNRMLVGREQGE